ncbi:MAG: helix-turn-helix transcriptional regulator [Candidatus Babeliaceae bacterium]|jgi:predicted XRE-type DNA-binding protein
MNNKDFEISSGNIFADLGVSNPEERLAKAKLAMQISILIKKKRLSQKDAAEFLGIDQPKISALYKGKLAGFSLERLFRFLNILGQEIIIKIAPKTKAKKTSNITVNLQKIKPKPTSAEVAPRSAVLAKKK